MKSLYELMENEHRIVEEIRKYEFDVYCFKRDIERAERIGIECKAKTLDIARWEDLISKTELAIENSKTELKYARGDIRRYFEELDE